MLTAIEISEPAANSRRSGRGEAALDGFMSTGAHISENAEAHIEIDINKPHIWSLSNYIIA